MIKDIVYEELKNDRRAMIEAIQSMKNNKDMMLLSGLTIQAYDRILVDIKEEYLKILEEIEICEQSGGDYVR